MSNLSSKVLVEKQTNIPFIVDLSEKSNLIFIIAV